MVDGVEPVEGGAAGTPLAGLVAHASLAYVRDNVQISCGGGDLLGTLLFTAILDANMAPLNRDPELRVRYGTLEDSCPDELRRPVSINAIAQSLHVPFETARRRVRQLAEAGDCVIVPQGVYVPRSAVTSPAYKAIQAARYDRVRAFHGDMRRLGVLPPEPAGPPPEDPLIRAVNRVVSEYMLRACNALIELTGDMLGSLVLMEMALLNLADLPSEQLAAWAEAPLQLGQPAPGTVLSARLRISPETVRRHILSLEADGFCRRLPRGLVAMAPPPARVELARLIEANLANVQRLFARLRELGVTASWEAEAGHRMSWATG